MGPFQDFFGFCEEEKVTGTEVGAVGSVLNHSDGVGARNSHVLRAACAGA